MLAILRDSEIGGIVVEHRDRLAGFGAEYIEASFAASGRRLIVIEQDEEQGEVEEDLARDMTEALTFFCARRYGRRSARHRARRALEAARA